MSAERCDMLAFVIAAQMFEDLNDVHRVVHLMNLVRHKLSDEMRWHPEIEVADNPTSAVAAVLRRRADEIQARR
jgi:hypothetical protein